MTRTHVLAMIAVVALGGAIVWIFGPKWSPGRDASRGPTAVADVGGTRTPTSPQVTNGAAASPSPIPHDEAKPPVQRVDTSAQDLTSRDATSNTRPSEPAPPAASPALNGAMTSVRRADADAPSMDTTGAAAGARPGEASAPAAAKSGRGKPGSANGSGKSANDPAAEFGPKPLVPTPVARLALELVGTDRAAEEIWVAAINDPATSEKDRADLIEDLNENGLPDLKDVTIDDLPLILSRLAIIEELAPEAMDEVNSTAFQEAYKDLRNMLKRLDR